MPDPKPGAAISVGVRLEPNLVARLDAVAVALSEPWATLTRSNAVRAAVELGLVELERRVQAKAEAKK